MPLPESMRPIYKSVHIRDMQIGERVYTAAICVNDGRLYVETGYIGILHFSVTSWDNVERRSDGWYYLGGNDKYSEEDDPCRRGSGIEPLKDGRSVEEGRQ